MPRKIHNNPDIKVRGEMPANSTALKFCNRGEMPEFGDQKLVSQFFGLTEAWLERDRWSGASGLPFYKLNSKVLYKISEVASFIEKRRRTSTSDQGAEG